MSKIIEDISESIRKLSLKELIRRLVIFSTLMEANDGIINKAPFYILEKFRAVLFGIYPENILDEHNRRIYNEWMKRWRY